jgi:cytochrome c-type biogenesis protein CcmH/NrfF
MGGLKTISYKVILFYISLATGQLCLGQSSTQLAEEFNSLTKEQQILFNEVSDNLRCPTCTGLSILQSDAPFSLQIRKAVIDQIKVNKDKKNILQFFTERYGLWILREPPTQGFHYLAWLIPSMMLIFGPLLIWFFVWRNPKSISTLGVRSSKEIAQEFFNQIKEQRSIK